MKYVNGKQVLTEICLVSLQSIKNPALEAGFVGCCLIVGSLKSRAWDKGSGVDSLFRWSQESQVRKSA